MSRGRGRSGRGGRGRPRRRGGGGGGRGYGRRSPRSLLRGAIGATLEGVVVNLAVHDGDIQADPVSMLLRFDNNTEIGATSGSDGESIRIGRKLYSPYPDEDPVMGVAEEDQTASEQWMAFVGKRCDDVLEVRDMSFGGKGCWSGLELCFEGGAVMSLFQWGDEFLTDAPDVEGDFLERCSVKRQDEADDSRGKSESSAGEKGSRAAGEDSSDGDGKGAGGKDPDGDDSDSDEDDDGEGKQGSGRGSRSRRSRGRRRRRSRRSGSDEDAEDDRSEEEE